LLRILSKTVVKIALIALLFAYIPLFQDYYYYDYKGESIVKVVRTSNSNSGGTGFQIKAPSGKLYILTNKHVCQVKDHYGKVRVITSTGDEQLLKVVKEYADHDLCLIEPFPGLRPLGIAKNIYTAEKVYLIGHPRLAPLTFERGYYRGNKEVTILYNVSKDNPCLAPMQRIMRCYLTYDSFSFNLISYSGNSGSPIIDVYGNVVSVLFAGVNSLANFTYGVPLIDIQEFLDDK